jgi:hypothetical protein
MGYYQGDYCGQLCAEQLKQIDGDEKCEEICLLALFYPLLTQVRPGRVPARYFNLILNNINLRLANRCYQV